MIDSTGTDIIREIEYWLIDQHLNTAIFSDNYRVYRRDRHAKKVGRVFIIVNDNFDSTELEKTEIQQKMWDTSNMGKYKEQECSSSVY